MVRMKIAGGCGENGRSCFFVDAGRPGAGFLVDCGVSQDGGFPRLTREEISRVSAVFLTSAAPERAGALPWLATQGFTGQVVAPACTLLQLPQTPARPVPLERLCEGHRYGSLGCVSFTYGRSGGSAGGLQPGGKITAFLRRLYRGYPALRLRSHPGHPRGCRRAGLRLRLPDGVL